MTPGYSAMNEAFADRIGLEHGVFERMVVIELPASTAWREGAGAAWLLAANLLVRIFRRVHLVAPPDVRLGPNPWQISLLADALPILERLSEGTVTWGAPAEVPDVGVAVGAPGTVLAARMTWFDYDGWTISVDRPAGSGRGGVLAALLAACWGASQAFLLAASDCGAELKPMDAFVWTIFQGQLPSSTNEVRLHLDDGRLAGVGAVGCAFVYALAHLSHVTGHLDLVDDDCVDLKNLHRYILMTRGDLEIRKPLIAEAALMHLDLEATPRLATYDEFVGEHGTKTDLLMTPVDSHAGRRALAATLPKRILDASTGDHTVTVSRHGFADGRACMHCLYAVRDPGSTTESRIASDLGLPVELVELYLAANRQMDSELIERIELFKGVSPGTYSAHVGARIQSFHQHAFCGSASFDTSAGRVVAPLSFISAAAGVLMTIELVVMQLSPDRASAYNYRRLDLFVAPDNGFVKNRRPAPDVRCICDDDDYREIYGATYGGDEALPARGRSLAS